MTNPGFTLDHKRVILEQIVLDTSQFVAETSGELYECRLGKYIVSTSELFIPEHKDFVNAYKSSAFIAGSAVVLAAFTESDLPLGTICGVRQKFVIPSQPNNQVASKDPEPTHVNERSASDGMKSHPEMRDHLDYVSHYFWEITQNVDYGKYVYTGGGFCLNRLDQCYNSLADEQVSGWIGQDLKSVEWERLLYSN